MSYILLPWDDDEIIPWTYYAQPLFHNLDPVIVFQNGYSEIVVAQALNKNWKVDSIRFAFGINNGMITWSESDILDHHSSSEDVMMEIEQFASARQFHFQEQCQHFREQQQRYQHWVRQYSSDIQYYLHQ